MKDLVRHGIRRKFSRGETLYAQGVRAFCICVVLEGWVKLSRVTPSGKEVIVAVFSKGESFGEAAALLGERYPVTVTAAEDCLVFQIPASEIAEKIRKNPELAMSMLATSYRHLHGMVLEIERMKGQSGAQRLANFLVTLAPKNAGPCEFLLPYDKGLIAGHLGMEPESLSRSFANLRSQGVRVRRNLVNVVDLTLLRNYGNAEKPLTVGLASTA